MATIHENQANNVSIPCDKITLTGDLIVPAGAGAVVIFVHGSGSSRHSSRNRYVASILNKAGIGTLLFDLLTEQEDVDYANRFNIPLLSERLLAATLWLRRCLQTESEHMGYFGASTGAAAALVAAAKLGTNVHAVVSRGGRPDLAASALSQVEAPTLLIVGENDPDVIKLNQTAYAQLHVEKDLVIISGATHLFEEPGTLEEVADVATRWFKRHLLGIVPYAYGQPGEEQSLD